MRARHLASVLAFVAAGSFLTSPAWAGEAEVEADFEKLRTVPADYVVFGSICEQIARLRLGDQYPKRDYDIEVGIEYKVGTRTVGELDVVVIRRADQKAVVVSEVKCWNDFNGAASKAQQQLKRFRTTIATNAAGVKLISKEAGNRTFSASQFTAQPKYMMISQDGGEPAGFDMTIGHDMDGVHELRNRLMACQSEGACPRGNEAGGHH